jgi:hypothetical protein
LCASSGDAIHGAIGRGKPTACRTSCRKDA